VPPGGTVAKTGRAAAMRAWMQGQKKPWTALDCCIGLGIDPGPLRERVRMDIGDFVKRGEIVVAGQVVKRNRLQNAYRYANNYRTGQARPGVLGPKIYKAMYVSCREFALSDIQRLSGVPKRSLLDKLIGPLRTGGYLQVVGRRRCAHGAGAETLYRIANRDKFRLEVMK